MELFNYTISKGNTVDIKSSDPNFLIHSPDSITLSHRASINISTKCPSHIANIIAEAYNRGWIEPVATVTDEEYTWMTLRKK